MLDCPPDHRPHVFENASGLDLDAPPQHRVGDVSHVAPTQLRKPDLPDDRHHVPAQPPLDLRLAPKCRALRVGEVGVDQGRHVSSRRSLARLGQGGDRSPRRRGRALPVPSRGPRRGWWRDRFLSSPVPSCRRAGIGSESTRPVPLFGDAQGEALHRLVEVVGSPVLRLCRRAKTVSQRHGRHEFPRPVRLHGTPWVPERALGCNGVQSRAVGCLSLSSLSRSLAAARNCSAVQGIALETTVNRLVAGSNPARGATRLQIADRLIPHAATPLAFSRAFFSGEISVSSLNSLRALSPRMFFFACSERNGRS